MIRFLTMNTKHNQRTLVSVGIALAQIAMLGLFLSCSTGGPATDLNVESPSQTAALTENLDSFDATLWDKANWTNGSMFNCGWKPDHAVVSDGILTLSLDNTASHEKVYTSGEFRSKCTFSYGTFTTRMKAAKSDGIVSSFFLYTGSPWDEIDFEVLGKDTTKVQLNYFVNGVGGHEKVIDLAFDASLGYHEYAIEWGKGYIAWHVDGTEKYRVTSSAGTLPTHPMQIMVNLWPGIGVDTWLKPFVYSAPLSASYENFTYVPAK